MAPLFSLIKSACRNTVKAGVRLYYKTRNWLPVWLFINRKAIRYYQKQKPHLDAIQKRITDDLAKNGIAIAHIQELLPDENMLEKLQQYAGDLEKNADVKTNKEFLKFYFDDVPELNLENPFIQLALQDSILNTVNSYMGMRTKFYYFTLNKTMPRGGDSKAIQSMRWHRDPEDKKMVKVFMYLNDVDETTGPFVYIPETHFEGKLGYLFPPEPPRGALPPPEEIAKIIPESKIKTCVGKAGTIIFCDTRGIHRGGHAISKERIMLTLGYSSPASSWPLRYQYPNGFTKKTIMNLSVSPAARYALDNFSRIGKKVYKY